MGFENKVTICITMGLRPYLLEKALQSLSPELASLPIIGINDFGDAETSAMFKKNARMERW